MTPYSQIRRARHIFTPLVFLGAAFSSGCQGFFEQPNESSTVSFRIENGTASFVEVTITVASEDSDVSGQSSSSDVQPSETDDGRNQGAADAPSGRDVPLPEPVVPESDPPDVTAEAADLDAAAREGVSGAFTIGLRDPLPPTDNTAAPTEAAMTEAKTTVAEGTVRLSPATFSDGLLRCGDEITISARISGNETTNVLLSGAGTGTSGFDSGSVGLAGERLLLNGAHFECGETIVVRVTDEGTSAGPGSAGTGVIEVHERGETPPAPVFDTGSTVDAGDGFLEFRIDNPTASFAQLHLVLGPPAGLVTAVSTEGAESDGGFDVRVPPGFLSTGVAACESQIIVVGSIVVPGVNIAAPDVFNQVVLSGLGTGTVSFDENSVGTTAQQRLLLEGTHYECGDAILVQFTDDGDPAGEAPGIGQATVSLVQ